MRNTLVPIVPKSIVILLFFLELSTSSLNKGLSRFWSSKIAVRIWIPNGRYCLLFFFLEKKNVKGRGMDHLIFFLGKEIFGPRL